MISLTLLAVWSAAPASPRLAPPPEAHFISDTTGQLKPTTLAAVDELGSTIHVGGFGELMVLVVTSTGKIPAPRFALDTFANWPVGHAENVDGALLVVALADQRAAVVLGDGYGRIPAAEVDALVAHAITPALKEGRGDDAVLQGAQALLRLLEKHHPPVMREAVAAQPTPAAPPPRPRPPPAPVEVPEPSTLIALMHLAALAVPLGAGALLLVACVLYVLRNR